MKREYKSISHLGHYVSLRFEEGTKKGIEDHFFNSVSEAYTKYKELKNKYHL